MRFLCIAAAALVLSGCMTLGGSGREIRTLPTGALITIDGFGECETPCTIKLDRKRRVRFAKAGYVTRYVDVEPSGGPVTVPLELAAASEDVDTTPLPDLD